MPQPLFFDHASTTPVSPAARAAMLPFETERFGNPSSAHGAGQVAAKAIADARRAFADWFNVEPAQVIFTGGGTEADNLAVQGVAMRALESATQDSARSLAASSSSAVPRSSREIFYSATEHPAVRETARALSRLGFSARELPVDAQGQILADAFDVLTEDNTALVSVQQVNNILGTLLPVEALARKVKEKAPRAVFHTDAVQAFGKVPTPRAPSAVDLVSISAHKVQGPKAVGALIILKRDLELRPLLFGGGHEGGMRSGTQSAALIAGFHAAAKDALARQKEATAHVRELRARLREGLITRGLLLAPDKDNGASLANTKPAETFRWNSPDDAVPFIVSLSLLNGLPAAAFARLLEDENCLVSTGSACHSARSKVEPEAALAAIGLPEALATAGLRISFSADTPAADVDHLVEACTRASARMNALHGGGRGAGKRK